MMWLVLFILGLDLRVDCQRTIELLGLKMLMKYQGGDIPGEIAKFLGDSRFFGVEKILMEGGSWECLS